jgi:hypothetical protein
MKMTKRIAAMVACAVMAASSMVSVCASATEMNCNDDSIVNVYENNIATPYISKSHSIAGLSYPFGQDKTNWCWAACTQQVLDYYYTEQDQADIVEYIKGSADVDEGGNVNDMAKALNYFTDTNDFSGYTGKMAVYSKVASKINLDKPVILAGTHTVGSDSKKHAVLCYGYDQSDSNALKLYVVSPTTSGGRNMTLVCSSTTSNTFKTPDGKETYTMSGYAAHN